MDDAIKHVSFQTFIKHHHDLSKEGQVPSKEVATEQAAIKDGAGNTVVASYEVIALAAEA